MSTWDATTAGVLELPSGRRIRGRGLRSSTAGEQLPDFGLYLLGRPPGPMNWDSRWVRWPDFWLPIDRADAADALREAWHRSSDDRVEVACAGGHGRTGTALACLAILDGVRSEQAVAFVRSNYHRQAIETPWQRRYVRRFRCP